MWYTNIKGSVKMIDFQKIDLSQKDRYREFLKNGGERGCTYSPVNLYLWGRQKAAFVGSHLAFFSQFDRHSIYPFPLGDGDVKPVLDALIDDARARGLKFCLSSMTDADCALLEELYPGKFCFHPDRDYCDYVYAIENLAKLPGRKYQRKRNHINRFRQNHPDWETAPIDKALFPRVQEMVDAWYASRTDPESPDEFHMEQVALRRAFEKWDELGLEGLVLMEKGKILAMTVGSPLTEDTFDIHFEKALDEADGAYPAINQAFAAHLQEKYPDLRWLNREDDMGLPGLRKAKLSYYPDHLVVKFWAELWEDEDEH